MNPTENPDRLPPPEASPGAPRLPRRGIAAHRGGTTTHPENTLAAFREAVRLGAHQIEFDVRGTADGELVVIHDPSVDRTTDGHGAVAELTLAELRRLDAGYRWGRAFARERIPTLSEVVDAMPRDVWLNVQIKRGEPIAAAVSRLLVERERAEQSILACGNAAAREARGVDPRLRICNLVRQRDRQAYLEHALATGSDFIQLHHLRGLPEPDLMARARQAGLRVNYFAGPEPVDLAALFDAGVDFVLVDDVPASLETARRLGILPAGHALPRG